MQINWDDSITLPIFRELYTTEADIILLWGGRLSGKSRNIPHITTKDSIQVPNSKTILIRKVYDTIKESIFSEYDAFLEVNGFYQHGIFKKKLSPLEITCMNGSKIIARGCDRPEKIKSVREPDTVVIEEADQLTEQDFDYILTTVRSSIKKCKIYLLFNPEFSAKGNWIKERFFSEALIGNQNMYGRVYYERKTVINDKEVILKTLAIHSTFLDNPHAPTERIAMINEYKNFDLNKYNVWALGLWGEAEIKRPYINTFKKDKHVKTTSFDRGDILLSFDFNVDPMTCTASQLQRGKIVVVDEYKLVNSCTEELCEYILPRLPKGNNIHVTGDASGKNRSANVRGGLNNYHTIQDSMKLSSYSFHLPSKNADVKGTRETVNKVFYNEMIEIGDNCQNLINDLTFVEADAFGKMVKKTSGSGKELSHFMDNLGYSIVNYWIKFIKL